MGAASAYAPSKWRHGTISVISSGVFTFRPGGPADMRFPKGQPVTVQYGQISEPIRSVGWSHAWSMNPLLRVARVSTHAGDTIELAPSASDKSLASLRDGNA
jgi:hypothetical protein